MKKTFVAAILISSLGLVFAQNNQPAPDFAPSNVIVSAAPGASVFTPVITWSDISSNEDGFIIERAVGAGNVQFVTIASLPANSMSYIDTSAANQVPKDKLGFFTYRVSAVNNFGTKAGPSVIIQKQVKTATVNQNLGQLLSTNNLSLVAKYLNLKVNEANALLQSQTESIAAVLINAAKASASGVSSQAGCVILSQNMYRGNESSATKKLQAFLAEKGFLTTAPTGFYGDLTVAAVKAYQRSMGLKETGMVFDFTRQAIQNETCQ